MIRSSCHCGAVKIAIPRQPETITQCNCSICRRYGPLWAYFAQREVEIEAAAGSTDEYIWGDRMIAFVRCCHCGCITHWRELAEPGDDARMGVNVRMFEPGQIGPARIRLRDDALT